MKDLSEAIQKALENQLGARGYDIVDLVPVPASGDRMVRIRTLEEALDDYDQGNGDTASYLIQLKPKRAPEPAPVDDRKPSLEGIYLADGQMNLPYLLKNAGLLFAAGEVALARNIYKAILHTGERSSVALYWIGRCNEADGKFGEALKSYEESIAYHPSLEAFERSAALLIRAKKDHEAAELLERTLNLRDLQPGTRFDLHHACGNCWMRAERLDKAEEHYRKALEINPDSDAVHASLGALHLQGGRHAQARKHFQDAVALNGRNDKALTGLASCHLAEGEKRLAHDFFARSLDINLSNPAAIYQLVKCAFEIKSYTTAARVLGEYIESAPVNSNLMYSLAGLQYHLGRIEEARTTARKIIELQPQHAGAAELLRMMDQHAAR